LLKENEALHDRMYPIFVPYNLKADQEEKILKKLIQRSEFRDLHLAPDVLAGAARFGILSRLTPSALCPDLFRKMRYYNGEPLVPEDRERFDLVQLRLEGRQKGEGMTGISPRFLLSAISLAFRRKGSAGCVKAIDVISGAP